MKILTAAREGESPQTGENLRLLMLHGYLSRAHKAHHKALTHYYSHNTPKANEALAAAYKHLSIANPLVQREHEKESFKYTKSFLDQLKRKLNK